MGTSQGATIVQTIKYWPIPIHIANIAIMGYLIHNKLNNIGTDIAKVRLIVFKSIKI